MALNQLLINQVITASDLMTRWDNVSKIEKENLSKINFTNLDFDITPVIENKKIVGIIEKGIEEIQGFMTSENNFVDRKDGGQIAFKAGQTSELSLYFDFTR